MKKNILPVIAALCIISFKSTAQISKGSLFTGADVGGYKQKLYPGTVHHPDILALAPVVGIALKENLLAGIQGFFIVNNDFSKESYESVNIKRYERGEGAGLFIRKYKQMGQQGFSLLLQGQLSYMATRLVDETHFPDSDNTYIYAGRKSCGFGVSPGVSFAISKRMRMETGLNNLLLLNYYKEDQVFSKSGINPSERNVIKGFGASTGLSDIGSSLYAGIRVIL